MTSIELAGQGLYLHKKCDHVGCITDAHVGLRFCVPSEGQVVHKGETPTGHMQKVLGVYLCLPHYHRMNANELFRRVLTPAMVKLFENYAKSRGRRPPDFRNAWFEALPMNAQALRDHEKAKQTATKL